MDPDHEHSINAIQAIEAILRGAPQVTVGWGYRASGWLWLSLCGSGTITLDEAGAGMPTGGRK